MKQVSSLVASAGGLLCSCFLLVAAVPFVPPADGPVPFRLDRVPLEASSMRGLSFSLRTIAESVPMNLPGERRAVAQMLALSLALEPGNQTAKILLERLPSGGSAGELDPKRIVRSKAHIWNLIGWLESSEAGPDGNELAKCLKDVMAAVDPDAPRSGEIRKSGELGRWEDWVPEVVAYEHREPEVADHNPPEEGSGGQEPEQNPAAAEESKPLLPLTAATLPALIWKREGEANREKWTLAPRPLVMSVAERKDPEGHSPRFGVSIGSLPESGRMHQVEREIVEALESKQGSLPRGVLVTIRGDDLDASLESRHEHALSGACAVLVHAAVTGVEPQGLVVGRIVEGGGFRMSSAFWEQMLAVAGVKGRRLIVPAEAEETVLAYLAMEKPEFFIQNDVLLAKDLEDLAVLSAKVPAVGVASALNGLQEIRARQGSSDFRQYLGNPFVRQKLTGILQAEPRCLSAKALLLQAQGLRPTVISRPVLVVELMKALEPLGWVAKADFIHTSQLDYLVASQEASRARIDPLARYASRTDQELVKSTRDVTDLLNPLVRALRVRREDWELEGAIRPPLVQFQRSFKEFRETLDGITKVRN